MFREGTALEALESADSRRFLPQALAATLLTIVVPALVVVALSPLSGLADLLLSAVLATGLSVAAGSAGATLWTRLPQSREIPFGDLMLWSWARRVRAERRLAKAVDGGAPLGPDGELAQLRTLAVVFEARDGFSHGHSGRVARHAERIARRLGLPAAEVERIEAAAAVHDIGLVRVPRAVLARRSQPDLAAEERELLQRHAVAGAEQVAAVAGPEIATLVRHQHECVDGSGYPDGLVGGQIPLGARIIAVADRVDELNTSASQRSLHGRRNLLDALSAAAGSKLDADVVGAFGAYYSGSRSIAGVALAATAPQRAVRWLVAAPGATLGAAGAPVALQSVCAAGATVLAGACLAGLPALDPERGGDRPAAGQRAEQRANGAALGDATELASAPAAAGRDKDDPSREGGPGRRDSGGDGRPSEPQPPATPGPGTDTPTAPGGDGGSGGAPPSTGGGAGAGGASPVPSTSPSPPVEVETPQVPSVPRPDASPVSRVVDPVLDGVSDAVPPAKPVTDVVKGVVGGLTGGLAGGGGQ